MTVTFDALVLTEFHQQTNQTHFLVNHLKTSTQTDFTGSLGVEMETAAQLQDLSCSVIILHTLFPFYMGEIKQDKHSVYFITYVYVTF